MAFRILPPTAIHLRVEFCGRIHHLHGFHVASGTYRWTCIRHRKKCRGALYTTTDGFDAVVLKVERHSCGAINFDCFATEIYLGSCEYCDKSGENLEMANQTMKENVVEDFDDDSERVSLPSPNPVGPRSSRSDISLIYCLTGLESATSVIDGAYDNLIPEHDPAATPSINNTNVKNKCDSNIQPSTKANENGSANYTKSVNGIKEGGNEKKSSLIETEIGKKGTHKCIVEARQVCMKVTSSSSKEIFITITAPNGEISDKIAVNVDDHSIFYAPKESGCGHGIWTLECYEKEQISFKKTSELKQLVQKPGIYDYIIDEKLVLKMTTEEHEIQKEVNADDGKQYQKIRIQEKVDEALGNFQEIIADTIGSMFKEYLEDHQKKKDK